MGAGAVGVMGATSTEMGTVVAMGALSIGMAEATGATDSTSATCSTSARATSATVTGATGATLSLLSLCVSWRFALEFRNDVGWRRYTNLYTRK
jgi:hypothetical protein